MESVVAVRVMQAFPVACGPDVANVLSVLQRGSHLPSANDIGPVVVGPDSLRIPARIYLPEPDPVDLRVLTESQRLIAHCLFTRHHDGHVRERMLRLVLPHNAMWTVPFVVELLGEYVIEIHRVLEAGIPPAREPSYASFLNDNSTFWHRTRQRVISYWNCYYRHEFPDRKDYPASRVVDRLDEWRVRDSQARRPASS
jgi:hypothetical protein